MKIEALISTLKQHPGLRVDATSAFRPFNVVDATLVDHGSYAFAYLEIAAPSVSGWCQAVGLISKLEQISDTHPGIDVMAFESAVAPYGEGEYDITRAIKTGNSVTLELEAEQYGF